MIESIRKATTEDIDILIKLRLEVEIKPPRTRVEGEGRSLYFYDFDNHLFELHTGTLLERLSRYSLDTCEQAYLVSGFQH